MNRRSIVRRAGAGFLAGVLVLCAYLPLFPRISRAASLVQEVGEDVVFPKEYGYSFRFTSKTGVEPFGMYDDLHDMIDPKGSQSFVVQELKSESQKGKMGVVYTNVGEYLGTNMDLKVTVMDWFETYDNWVDDSSGEATKPFVMFRRNDIRMNLNAVEGARFKFEFLEHDTGKVVNVKGHATLADLDDTQKFGFEKKEGIDAVYVLKGNSHLKAKGDFIESADALTASDDPIGWSSVFFDGPFSLDFYTAVKSHGERVHLQRDEKGFLVTSTFLFTAYAMGRFEISEELHKRVGMVGASWEEAKEASIESPYEFQEYDAFEYQIRHEISPNKLVKYEMRDRLDDCLRVTDSEEIRVTDQYGVDVTNEFAVTVSGQEVVVSAREKELSKESFTANETYTFHIPVQRRVDWEVEKNHYIMNGDGYTFRIPNTASLTWQREDGSNKKLESPDVWVQSKMLCELEVEKRAPYEWQVGEIVDYEVVIRQTREYAHGVNLVAEDLAIPEGLTLLGKATSSGAQNVALTREGPNGWRLTCPRLEEKDTIVVCFQCKATEASAGRELLNTVEVRADNYINPETMQPRCARDSQDIWVNTPLLLVDKTVSKYEWQIGEEILYQVVVNNIRDYTVGKKIQISDESLPSGLVLAREDAVTVRGIPETVNYPSADKKTGFIMEPRENHWNLKWEEKGWNLTMDYLPPQMPVLINFRCIATEEANGRESQNVVRAWGENVAETVDDGECYVNTAVFAIDKSADHYEWKVGEAVEYQVRVRNTFPGTIARNVVIRDMELPEGLTLKVPDVRVEGIPKTIENPVAGTEDTPSEMNQGLYHEVENKPVTWQMIQGEKGWNLEISDLAAQEEVVITFSCTASIEANGKESVNRASVEADNGTLVQDDAESYVNTALLTLDKRVNNENLNKNDNRLPNEFRVGEIVEYELELNNKNPGSIARNVVITDASLPEGLEIPDEENAIIWEGLPDTFQDPVAGKPDDPSELNPPNYGETEEKPIERKLVREGNGFSFHISDLPYETPVTLRIRCIPKESINGMEVVNRACAKADNASWVEDSEKIWINSPVLKVEKKADKPEYKYGDIATYQIHLTQEQTGCAARNVFLEDVLQTEGVKLQKNSIVLLDGNDRKVEAEIQVTGENFIIHTGRMLVKEDYYSVWDARQEDKVLQGSYNPLNADEETSMTIEYQAAIVDPALAGAQVVNTVRVNSDENFPAETQETISIHSPILDIRKESDHRYYRVGEIGYYKLTIRQLREDVTAHQIVVRDAFEEINMAIVENSIAVRLNGQTIANGKLLVHPNHFEVETGVDLEDKDKLEIYYQVAFDHPKLAGTVLHNAAYAEGCDTPRVRSDLEVEILEQGEEPDCSETPEPTKKPDCSESPEPTKEPDCSETPEPTKEPDCSESPEPTKEPTATQTPGATSTPRPVYTVSSGGSSSSGGYGGSTSSGNSDKVSSLKGDLVKTGDDSPLLLLLLLFAGGLSTSALILWERRRRNRNIRRGLFR